MRTAQSTGFSLDAMRRAIHDGDVEAMVALYADDAEIEVVDQRNPPGSPSVIAGHERIRAMFTDVFGRDMTHEVTRAIADDDTAAYQVRCRYADGIRVLVMGMLELRDGRIVREEVMQAWDG